MNLPPDQKAQLWHAAMYRHGMACFRKEISEGEATQSLAERVKAIFNTTD